MMKTATILILALALGACEADSAETGSNTNGQGGGTGGMQQGTGGMQQGTGGAQQGTGGVQQGTGGAQQGTGGAQQGGMAGMQQGGAGGAQQGGTGGMDGMGGPATVATCDACKVTYCQAQLDAVAAKAKAQAVSDCVAGNECDSTCCGPCGDAFYQASGVIYNPASVSEDVKEACKSENSNDCALATQLGDCRRANCEDQCPSFPCVD